MPIKAYHKLVRDCIPEIIEADGKICVCETLTDEDYIHMQMLHHTKTLGVIQVDESVWKKLTREEKREIEQICFEKLEQYYRRLNQ